MNEDQILRLKSNISRVEQRIEAACERSGRDPREVILVAVTKTVPPEAADALLQAGVENIGENRVAEAERKRDHLKDRGVWHMIGHLQRNKVKKALSLFSVIHSVDSERLLLEISKQCGSTGQSVEIFLEVNVSGEESKYGITPAEAKDMVLKARDLPGIVLRGLMTMAPFDVDPETARSFFQGLRDLMERLKASGAAPKECDLLSMGMSGDFEVAVEEGATHVRIGTSLFEGLNLQ